MYTLDSDMENEELEEQPEWDGGLSRRELKLLPPTVRRRILRERREQFTLEAECLKDAGLPGALYDGFGPD